VIATLREHRIAAAGLLALGVLYVAIFRADVTAHVQGDGHYTYLWARSIAFDGDLDLRNDYALCSDFWHMAVPVAPGLGPQNTWPVGPAYLWAPALLAARALDIAGPENACSGRRAEAAMAMSCLAGWLAVVLAYVVARRRCSEVAALLGALAVGLGTALPYYASILPSYSHAPSAFAVALFVERWDATRGDMRFRRWAGLGLLLGFVAAMRPQDVLVAVLPLGEWLRAARAHLRRRNLAGALRHLNLGVVFVLCAVPLFFPQMAAWRLSYGKWLAVPQGPHYMRWTTPFVDGFLFGSANGLLSWTPVLYLAVAGAVLGVRRASWRPIGLPLALLVALAVYVNSAVWDYWGAVGFAGRRIVDMALPFAVLTALCVEALLEQAARAPRAFAATAVALGLALLALWNGAAMKGVARGSLATWHEAPMPVFWRTTFEILADDVHGLVGNPFALPGSVPLALRYRTHPARFDVLRGMGLFYEEFQTRIPRGGEDVARFAEPKWEGYLADGFAAERASVRGRLAAVTEGPRARLLLPIFAEDARFAEPTWASVPRADAIPAMEVGGGIGPSDAPVRVVVRWRGVWLHEAMVSTWTTARIPLPHGLVRPGVNEVVFEVSGGELALESLRLAK
jgi:hypothetical protein